MAISVVGSLTVLPALLSKLGDKVNKGRVPFLRSPDQRVGENHFWGAILGPVLRHPLISGLLAAGLLIALAVALTLEVIWIARHVLAWVVIAVFLALALDPLVGWIERRGRIPRGPAIGLAYLLLLVVIVGEGKRARRVER